MTTGFAAALTGGLIVAWLVGHAVVVAATRPARVRGDTPTQQLREEPPAVVNLLVNRWRLAGSRAGGVAEATLLDLASRGIVTLRQVGPDPMDTTVQVGPRPPEGLLPYEEQVLDRVRRLAEAGEVPVRSLRFRERDRFHGWQLRLRRAVVADARRRGLSRRRIGPTTAWVLGTAAVGPALGLALLAYTVIGWNPLVLAFGLLGLVALWVLLSWSMGERDTAAGLHAARHWLGVQAWLRAHDGFAELPPAAVTVWDRYLPYGLALGVNLVAARALDLGMANRRRIWSGYGGRWRQVRVRYPRGRPHLGLPTGGVVALAVVVTFPGWMAVCVAAVSLEWYGWAGVGVALAALAVPVAYSGYLVAQIQRDRHSRTVTGEVLWVRPWRHRWWDRTNHQPWLHYLAVDDGTGDRSTAWGLPSEWADQVVAGDIVELEVRPWSRRVLRLRTVTPSPRRADPGARELRQVPGQRTMWQHPRTPEPEPPVSGTAR